MGRSSEPGRDRRRSGTGEAAVTASSLGLDPGVSFPRGNGRGLGLRATGKGETESKHRGSRAECARWDGSGRNRRV